MKECNSIHARIDTEWEHWKVYTQEEYELIMSMARRKPVPYKVNTCQYSDFYEEHDVGKKIVKNRTEDVVSQTVE